MLVKTKYIYTRAFYMIGLYTYTFTILENRAFFEKILCNPYVCVKGKYGRFGSRWNGVVCVRCTWSDQALYSSLAAQPPYGLMARRRNRSRRRGCSCSCR